MIKRARKYLLVAPVIFEVWAEDGDIKGAIKTGNSYTLEELADKKAVLGNVLKNKVFESKELVEYNDQPELKKPHLEIVA